MCLLDGRVWDAENMAFKGQTDEDREKDTIYKARRKASEESKLRHFDLRLSVSKMLRT